MKQFQQHTSPIHTESATQNSPEIGSGYANSASSSPEPLAAVAPPGLKAPKPASRVLKQDAAVVMPQSASSLGNLSVQFGAMNVEDDSQVYFLR